jgi:type I restriction enzyme S subunit
MSEARAGVFEETEGDEVAKAIPDNWTKVTLAEIGCFERGISFPKTARCDSASFATVYCLRTANIQDDIEYDDVWIVERGYLKNDEKKLRENDIIISMSNSLNLVGKAAIATSVSDEFTFGAFLAAFRVSSAALASYVHRYLTAQIARNWIQERASTTTNISNIGVGTLGKLPLPLPPLAEQKRIASKIDELFSDIEAGERALKRARAALARYRKSVLKAAVTGDLTADWRAANKDRLEPAEKLLARILTARREAWEKSEREKLKAQGKTPKGEEWKKRYRDATNPRIGAELEIPPSWAGLSLEQSTSASRPIAYGVLQPGDQFDGGTKLIRICDVGDGKVNSSKIKEIDPKIANQFSRTFVEGGEVLLTLVGTIGRTAIVPKSLAGANVARAVGVLVPVDGIEPSWMEFCLRSERTRQLLVENSREVARKTLNIEQVREYCIPVPPLAEQTEIVSRVEEAFSKAGHVEAALDEQERAARALKQSILKAAFEGRLVPQDPADEPAAKLLERIKKGRR